MSGRGYEGGRQLKVNGCKKLVKGPQKKSTLLLSLPIAGRIASLPRNHSFTHQNFIAHTQAVWQAKEVCL